MPMHRARSQRPVAWDDLARAYVHVTWRLSGELKRQATENPPSTGGHLKGISVAEASYRAHGLPRLEFGHSGIGSKHARSAISLTLFHFDRVRAVVLERNTEGILHIFGRAGSKQECAADR
jgi:hypothetical protein